MEKISIKKELYILNYEFLKFYLIFPIFYLIFNWIFRLFFSENIEKGGEITCGWPGERSWRGDRAQGTADVARGSTAPSRRGAEATWQGACGPRGARVALTRGTRPHGRSTWAPRGERVRMWRAHRYSGPWLDFRGGNAIGVNRPLIYRREEIFFLPCGTMSHTCLSFAGHVDAQGTLDRIKRRKIRPRGSQGGDQSEERLIRQTSLFRVTRGTPAEEAAANRKKGTLFRRLIRQTYHVFFFRNNGRWRRGRMRRRDSWRRLIRQRRKERFLAAH